jgi:hypothetical protein
MSAYCCVLVIFVIINVSLSLSLCNQNHSLENNDNAFQSSSLQSKLLKVYLHLAPIKTLSEISKLNTQRTKLQVLDVQLQTMQIIRKLPEADLCVIL